ncbi:hypothetical protein [Pontibacter chitinilyticus]|uniref:hypothetical protein n=1 Tax=Pontibacter chitinilyticus TaxID=2674989 RepID=UPI003218FE02
MSIPVYVLNLSILLALVWLLQRQHWAVALKPYFYPALLLKLLCGVLLGLLYFEYYGLGDTIAYYKGSLILTELAHKDAAAYSRLVFFNEFSSEAFRASIPYSRFPGFTNSFFFLKLLSLLNLLTGSSYYLDGLYFSLFSFWGAGKLTATLNQAFPRYKPAAVIAFLFFPSVVFWSSGVLKDSLLFGSMCWLIALVLQLGQRQRPSVAARWLAPLMLLLFYSIKFFLAYLLLPLLLLYLLFKYNPLQLKPAQQVLLMAAAVGVLAMAGLLFFKVYAQGFFYRNVVEGYAFMLAHSLDKPHIEFHDLAPGIKSFVLHAPEAALSSIYRPFVWENSNMLYLALALENLVLLLLTVLALLSAVRKRKVRITLEQVLFGAIVLFLAVLFGLSTPNFGTLSRYRIAFLPFLVYLLLQSHYTQALLRKLR